MNEWELITSTNPQSWNDILKLLKCELIYQTYEWGEIQKTKGWIPYRFAQYDGNGNVLTSVQILTKKYFGIHVVWIPGGIGGDINQLNKLFHEAVKKYLAANIIYFRVNIQIQSDDSIILQLKSNNWKRPSKKITSGQSMIYPVSLDENDRFLLVSKNWRHNLRRAMKRSSEVKRILNPDIQELCDLYSEMIKYKGLEVQFTKNQLISIFHNFNKQLFYYECRDESGSLIAIRAIVVVGNTGWDLLAASNNAARKQYATYRIIWKLLFDLNKIGVKICEMGGIDPENNPGVYQFKKGLGSKKIDYLGEYEWSNIPLLRHIMSLLI